MIDRITCILLGGSAFFAAILALELHADSGKTTAPAILPAKAAAKTAEPTGHPLAVDKLVATILSRPLFSAGRRPPEDASDSAPDTSLSDMRLTGILISPKQRLAIFAKSGGKPLVRSEGEMIDDWRVDDIAARSVSLSGPAGTTTLAPKADPNLAHTRSAAQQGPPSSQAAAHPAPSPPVQGTNAAEPPAILARRSYR
jgi:general secretion pathway protein N